MQETQVQFLHQEDPLEEDMATHSSILAWRIPGTDEIGGLTVHRSTRIRNRLATEEKEMVAYGLRVHLGLGAAGG